MSDLAATIGRSRMRGMLALDLSRERPRLTADLTAETLVVDELLALAPDPGGRPDPAKTDRSEADRSEPGSGGSDPPAGGIDLTGLRALDADLQANAQRLEYERWHLNEAQVHLLIDDGVLRLSPLSATVGDGRVAADLTLATDPIAGQAGLEIESLDLGAAVSAAGQDPDDEADEGLGVLDGSLLVALPPGAQGSHASAAAVLEPRRALARLRVQRGQLSYREPENDTRLRLSLAADQRDARPSVSVEGRLRGLSVDGTLSADPLLALVKAERYAAEGRLRLGDTTTRFEAVLSSPPSLRQLRNANLGESDLDGRIAIDPDNVPTAVNVDLRSDQLDLDDLLDLLDQRPRVEPDLLFPDRPIGLAALGRQLQGRVSYRAAQVVAARVPLSHVSLEARLRDGRLHLEPLRIGVGGGDLDRQRIDLVVEARPKDLSLPAFGSPLRLSGPLKDLELNLVSAELIGRTLAAVGLAAVQPLAGLLPLIEPGGNSSSAYCSGLMERLREAHR